MCGRGRGRAGMTALRRRVVVVGASLAGLRAAEELRAQGFDGVITLVGEEPHFPYDRPPLSKQLLAGDWEIERAALTAGSDDGLDALEFDWRLATRATGLDLDARSVVLADGDGVPFDGLVVATGATPRRLHDTAHPDGVHVLRTLDDCLAIRATLDATPQRVVVVGGGFIGAEVAATARSRGLDVTLLEALPVPLGRALGHEIGGVMADLHRDHGVDVRLGVAVAGLDGIGRVERVRLADGTALEADLVVVGVGVTPATGWLEGSGLRLADGVVCDETTLAAPGVVAAGDVARWPSRRFGAVIRVEHWDNAVTMGVHAAQRLLAHLAAMGGTAPIATTVSTAGPVATATTGPTAASPVTAEPAQGEPYDPVPWFWSDQYDRKIQLAGWPAGAEEVRIVDGSTDERRFVAIYRTGDRISAVLAMNRPRPMMTYRLLIEEDASWDEAMAVSMT